MLRGTKGHSPALLVHRSPLSPLQWYMFMLAPPDEDTGMLMYKAGQADGVAWAKSMGWGEPAIAIATS